ncbi:hypothetical protein HPB49_000636 [Dermacentor silvarum]|uniref:Uncharacterized protein n=1 Tax=Dermacentor silvarum TaxID=543639 RepID=A0ACB8D1Q3_DERSI|nr:hypothetical protein HPB49_000636 [Dermacentor silvarum]
MTSHTNEITLEHRNANSTRPGTRPVSEVDEKVDAAGSASLTATPLMTTSLEDNMEHEDDDTSDWSPVNYRRYTTRRLKGELRSERVSRPHFFVLVRPLNQMSIEEVPKSTITRLIGQTAPTSVASEHSAFRYIPKANAVRLSIWDQQHLNNLLAQRELTLTPGTSGEAHRIPVEIVDATQPAEVTSKGVVKIRPEHTEEYIANHIRCESANILGFRIMGKTQMLLVTFDTPHPPRRLSLDYEIVPVYGPWHASGVTGWATWPSSAPRRQYVVTAVERIRKIANVKRHHSALPARQRGIFLWPPTAPLERVKPQAHHLPRNLLLLKQNVESRNYR